MLRELFCILGLLCHAAVALRFRDLLHHKISKNGGQKMSYHYWLFGHYHDNRAIDEKHILLWDQIIQVI